MSVTAAAKKPGGMLDEVQRVLGQFETLQADVQALRQQREDLRRFLDIDAETAERGRVRRGACPWRRGQPCSEFPVMYQSRRANRAGRETQHRGVRHRRLDCGCPAADRGGDGGLYVGAS